MNDDLTPALRRLLADRTAGAPADPDWDDLAQRVARRGRRRTTALGAGLVVALVAGPLGGYVAGRAADGDEESLAIGAEGATRDDGVVEGASGYGRLGGGSIDRMELVFVRDVGDVRLRTWSASTTAPADGNPLWDAPAWCYPSGYVNVELSTPTIAAIEGVDHYGAQEDGQVGVAHASIVGVSEGEPMWVALVTTRPDAGEVTATFPDGSTDSMAPVDGVAALVAPAPAGSTFADVEVLAVDVTIEGPFGTVHETARPYWVVADESASQPSDAECMPPLPTLPAAGEQPADPAAARAGIGAAYEGLYSFVGDEGSRAHLEDADALAGAYEQLEEQGIPVTEGTELHPTIREIVFDRPDHAWVRFDLEIVGTTTYPDRIGEAVVVDGTWRVANATVCEDLALAGVTC